jgi:glycosyltransferase involved in cell wall biosynthesis
LKIQYDLNLTFHKKLDNKINIAIYYNSIKNGGIERLIALLLYYLSSIDIFNTFLLTRQHKEKNEYSIPKKTQRIMVNHRRRNDIIKILKREKIDILIYHFYDELEIKTLNNLKNTKTIYYNHSCALIWIYAQFYYYYRTLYSAYKQSKYVISLVPFENDYLFKKWGINSILMSNFISYEYNSVIPSDLSSKTILMIGRGSDRLKRFELGVESMKYIIKEIQDIKMKIISDFFLIEHLKQLVNKLNLDNCVEFVGYTSVPEIFFNNASLHIFPSICESFGLVLSETKIFGIPNIVVGLDYISIVKGGTIILYDDKSESIAKEAIKILKDDNYRKKLGREARKSMKKFKNELLLKKWIKLILSIYNGDSYYLNLRKEDEKIPENESLIILKKQVELLKMRMPNFANITVKNIENFTYMKYLK